MGRALKVKMAVNDLIVIQTRVEVAVEKESSGAHAICTGTTDEPHPPSRVKQSTACPVCGTGHSSAFGFDKRGVERDGKLVELTQEELQAAAGTPLTGGKDKPPVHLRFHPREELYSATLASDSVQNVYPDKGAEKPYVLLRDYLRDHPEVVAAVTWAPSRVNALWVLEVVGQRLVMSKRCYPEQVRATQEVAPVEYSDQEAALMAQLIEASVSDFDLSEYVDTAKRGVENLIAERVGTAVPAAAEPAITSAPLGGDLLAALQASVDAVAPQGKPKVATTKKAVAKKPATKKTAAPKRTAKKALPKSA